MPPRMLIVDDEEPITFALGRYFRRNGFDVDTACALEPARDLLRAVRYAIVLTDLRVSGFDGKEGLEVLSLARECSPDTRTVLLTAYDSPEIRSEALALGVSVVLRKPQTLTALAEVVSGLLRP